MLSADAVHVRGELVADREPFASIADVLELAMTLVLKLVASGLKRKQYIVRDLLEAVRKIDRGPDLDAAAELQVVDAGSGHVAHLRLLKLDRVLFEVLGDQQGVERADGDVEVDQGGTDAFAAVAVGELADTVTV